MSRGISDDAAETVVEEFHTSTKAGVEQCRTAVENKMYHIGPLVD